MVKRQRPTTRTPDGKRVTQFGTLDRRHGNRVRIENDGEPYAKFVVEYRATDARCFHVVRYDLADGKRTLLSRHASQETAEKLTEQHRVKQPDRKPSRQLKHLLGID